MSIKSLTLTAFTLLLIASPAAAQVDAIPASEDTEMPASETMAPAEMPAAEPVAEAPVVETPSAEATTETTTETVVETPSETPVETPAETPVEEAAAPAPVVQEEPKKPTPPPVVKIPQDPALAFMRFDVDGDGMVNATEFAASGIPTPLFNTMDGNKDGALSSAEIQIYNNGSGH